MYSSIPEDPTNKLKNKVAQTLKNISTPEDIVTLNAKDCISPAQLPQISMVYPKYTSLAFPQAHCL